MSNSFAIVSLGAISYNLRQIKTLTSKPIWAVVKANAYGHGAIPVAHRIQNEVYGFCCATVNEGIQLRVSGIGSPVLVFTPPTTRYECDQLRYYDLIATINSVSCANMCKGMPCHIKINTGMNRYGVSGEQLSQVLSVLQPEQILGVYSHLYAPQNMAVAQNQRRLFEQAVKEVKAVNPQVMAHLSASGGILLGQDYHFDAVRTGIMLYGYAPYGKNVLQLKKALHIYATRIQQTDCVGEGAGYQPKPSDLHRSATYRLGYADGFRRGDSLGVGNLCMDAFVGEDRGEYIPVMVDADEVAHRQNTISYEVLCRTSPRLDIIYQEELL